MVPSGEAQVEHGRISVRQLAAGTGMKDVTNSDY